MVVHNQQKKLVSDYTDSKDNSNAISQATRDDDDKKDNDETATMRKNPPNETKSNSNDFSNNNKKCTIIDKSMGRKTNTNNNKKSIKRKDDNDGITDDDDDDENDNSIFDINACSLCHCCLDYSDRAAFFRLDREEDYKFKNNNSNNNTNNNNTKVESNDTSHAKTENKHIADTSNNHISTNDRTNDHTIAIIGNGVTKMSIPNNETTATVITGQTCYDDTTTLYGAIPSTQLTNGSSIEVATKVEDTVQSDTNRQSATTVINGSQKCKEKSTNDFSTITDETTNTVGNDNGESNNAEVPTPVPSMTERQHGGSNNATGRDDKKIKFRKNENNKSNDNNDGDDSSSFYFRPDDPYLPQSLYDPDNAIVYCDSCDRIFHQKCHFVPIVQVPKGEWHCLICSTKTTTKSNNKKKNGNNQSTKKSMKKTTEMHVYNEDIFKSPPISAVRDEEMRWESDPRVITAKAELLQQWTSMTIEKKKGNTTSTRHSSTSSKLKRCTMTHLQNARLAETALSTLLSTQQNRKYCYDTKTGTPSQELVQSIYKFYSAKYKLKCLINTIESIRSAMPQFKYWSTLLQWINQYNRISINNNTTAIVTSTTTTVSDKRLQDNGCNKNNIIINHPSIDFVERILFPFGLNYERRWEPRTPEFEKIHTEFVIATDYDHIDNDNNKVIESYNRNDAFDISIFENGVAAPTSTSKEEEEQQRHLEKSPAPQRIRKIGSSSKIPNEIILHDNDNNHTVSNSICRPAKSLHDIDEHDEECPNRESKFSKRKTSNCSDSTSKSTRSNGSFSLDRLTCSACLKKTTSDDNDMILCDGEGCFRAYHMNCVHPAVTKDEVEQDESWFCPWCSSIADWMHDVQVHWKGDEWEKRKLGYISNDGKNGGSISHSLRSWDEVNEVFPESDWEYKTSATLKAGVIDDDGKRLLAQVLGLDDDNNNIADDDEDVLEIDGNFDLNSYEIARKLEYEQLKKMTDTDDVSHNETNEDSSDTHSSQVTLGEMSSVELEIGQDELAALSDEDLLSGSGDEALPGMNDTEGNDGKTNMDNQRRSKRLRKCADVATDAIKDTSNNGSDSSEDDDDDPGGMNEKNIVVGKRNRKPVDYRRLNDAMFGDLDEEAVANLDGGDDFGKTNRSGKKEAKPKSTLSTSPLQVGSKTSNNDLSPTNQETKSRSKKTTKSVRER